MGNPYIIASIDEAIVANKTYAVSSRSVMIFLDRLFNFNLNENSAYGDYPIYVKFSAFWKDRFVEFTQKAAPNLLDASVFYGKFELFDSDINSSVLINKFVNECNIRINELEQMFSINESKVIKCEDYSIESLVKAIETQFGVKGRDSLYLSLESPFFIQSKPSELKRAPFIQTLYSGDRIKELLLISDSNLDELYPGKSPIKEKVTFGSTIKDFRKACDSVGFSIENLFLTRLVASLLTKPFVILSGLSGSGKTKLAQNFVKWICQDPSQYCIIPVGADWTNREPLLGYPNALKPEEYVKPESGVLDLIMRASEQTDLPHFLILDEMNLSHVERYFADFLSTMESQESIPLYAEVLLIMEFLQH
ncbi:MAG: hypothetical protein IPP99_03105 [Chitinophagaceae bacterium]|nr:hypothetical protein [Chitinophagaceae bacterium]